MTKQGNNKNKIALICIFVFLCILAGAFYYIDNNQKETLNHTGRHNLITIDTEETPEEKAFAEKNKEEIAQLKKVQDKLIEALPKLSVTSREFNQRLAPLIELLKNTEDNLAENWQQFQTDFAYEYNKMNNDSQYREKLPKEVQESEQEIIQILQEVNQIIQQMHK